MAYYFAPSQSATVNVSLCRSSGQVFDTKLYLFQGLNGSTPAPVPVACDDDFCGYQASLSVRSGLPQLVLLEACRVSGLPQQHCSQQGCRQGCRQHHPRSCCPATSSTLSG